MIFITTNNPHVQSQKRLSKWFKATNNILSVNFKQQFFYQLKLTSKKHFLASKTLKFAFPVNIKLVYKITQPAFTCPKLTAETLEQGVEYVQS